jgi:hypothetical protein
MKQQSIPSRFVGLAVWVGLCLMALAQGNPEFVPNTITGTLTFNNASPAVLNLLNTPGNDGMSNLLVYADSVPAARSSISPWQPTASRTQGDYEVTVDSTTNGIAYSLAPVAVVGSGAQYYWFRSQTSAPVVANMAGPVVNFSECVGVLQLNFFTAEGVPAAVNTININGTRTADGTASLTLGASPNSSTQRLYVEGGQEHRLYLRLSRGSDPYTDRQVYFLATNVTAVCDGIVQVDIFFPPAETFGNITGNVDMLGEFEWSVEGYNQVGAQNPDYTSVIANYGPFQNERWDALPGDNLIFPSSGAFNLINVTPSTVDPASVGYAMEAVMLFRPNRMIQYFRTPGLGWGTNNPAVVISPGATVNLSNTFVINPGYLRGRILLQGPAGAGAHPPLRGVLHAGDFDADNDTIPDYLGTYGVYYSAIGADGVDRKAAGATYAAEHGSGYGDFDGAFDEPGNAYRGNYELVLGGLLGESSVWKRNQFNLTLNSDTGATEDDYFYNYFSIVDRAAAEVEITPGVVETKDVAYCFSEVTVRFRSPNSTFYAPQVRLENGSFVGTDFQGNPANYIIGSGVASGTPLYQSEATNRGQVLLCLPQGTYTLLPGVIPGDASSGITGLEPIQLTVGCGQRLVIEPCLQMNLAIPACYSSNNLTLAGSVRSCGNNVTQITYELNGGPPQTICNNCGADPAFSFSPTLAAGTNTLTVTASDESGGITSVTGVLRPDEAPPVIQCPADIVVETLSDSAVVNFTVTATDDCDPNPLIVCTPPSGSVFESGDTIVSCTATDTAGRESACSFKITVEGCLRLVFEHPICTTNFGFLARASVFACGAILTNLSLSAYSLVEPTARLGYSDIRILEPAGMARTNLTTAHGLFPEFDGFPQSYYADILYTVTARANDGQVLIRQFVEHYDFTPPMMNCEDRIVTATNGSNAVVNFTAMDERTNGVAILTCNPPSGTAFPIGTNIVTCTARDLCHNTNTCTFKVIVRPVQCVLSIERAVMVNWGCTGTLQFADDPSGPWTDIPGATSPYCTPAGAAHQYYRTRE